MRFALALVLLCALDASALQRRDRARRATPALEVLPGGTGLGISTDYPAAGSVQGTRGEVLTNGRSTIRTCSSLDESAMITIPANGTCVRGLAVDVSAASTNLVARSEETDLTPWANAAVGAAVPTITANAAIAPDGTQTAERFDFPAAPLSGDLSVRYQNITVAAGSNANSLFLKGVSRAGSIYLYAYNATDLQHGIVLCSFVADKWTRCKAPNSPTVTSDSINFGNVNGIAGMTDRGAQSVYVWGAQYNDDPAVIDYCPTAGTAPVTCGADVMSVATSADWPAIEGTVEVDYTPDSATVAATAILLDTRSGSPWAGWALYRLDTGNLAMNHRSGASASNTAASAVLTWTAGQRYRIRAEWLAGGLVRLYRDGVLVAEQTLAATAASVGATAWIGSVTGGGTGNNALGRLSSVRVAR